MTIRDYIYRKRRYGITLMFVAFVSSLTFGLKLNMQMPAIACGILFMTGAFWIESIRCPKCKGPLGRVINRGFSWKLDQRFTCCPYCGTNLDSEFPE